MHTLLTLKKHLCHWRKQRICTFGLSTIFPMNRQHRERPTKWRVKKSKRNTIWLRKWTNCLWMGWETLLALNYGQHNLVIGFLIHALNGDLQRHLFKCMFRCSFFIEKSQSENNYGIFLCYDARCTQIKPIWD